MVREIQVSDGNGGKQPASLTQAVAKRQKKQRVAVFIDGSNLYFKLRTLVPHKMDFIRFRYRDLVQGLLGSDEKVVYIGYYVGVVRDTKRSLNHDKTQQLVQNQQKLFEQLRHQQIQVVKGYLLERDGRYFEKGVDVRLAVDIIDMAVARKYDRALLISSDTDLIPALVSAQARKRHITYVGFEHQPSLALIRQADRSRLVSRQEIERLTEQPLAVRRFDEP